MTMLNKKHSEETKLKMSKAAKGNKSFTGHKHTEEWKQKMRYPRPHKPGRIYYNKGKGKYKTRKEKDRGQNLRRYGLDEIKYEALLVNQGYVCAICLKPETRKFKDGTVCRLSIDHCHETKKVRGLLCSKCNFAIGQLDDNPYLCEMAKNYLLKNN